MRTLDQLAQAHVLRRHGAGDADIAEALGTEALQAFLQAEVLMTHGLTLRQISTMDAVQRERAVAHYRHVAKVTATNSALPRTDLQQRADRARVLLGAGRPRQLV